MICAEPHARLFGATELWQMELQSPSAELRCSTVSLLENRCPEPLAGLRSQNGWLKMVCGSSHLRAYLTTYLRIMDTGMHACMHACMHGGTK